MINATITQFSHRGQSRPLFRDLSFTLPKGQITCVLGLSGSGKTSLLKLMLGIDKGDFHGKVEYHVADEAFSPLEAKQKGLIGILTDHAPLIPWLNLKENIRLPSRLNPMLHCPTETAITDALQAFNLRTEHLALLPHELSVGMNYRASLVRLFAYKPRFLFLDELFAGLDPINCDLVIGAVRSLVSDQTTCLIVTQDINRAIDLASDIYYLSQNGTIVPVISPTLESVVDLMRTDSDTGFTIHLKKGNAT